MKKSGAWEALSTITNSESACSAPVSEQTWIEGRSTLSRIKGLTSTEISSDMCCRTVPQEIFAKCTTDTLVTPSQCCYSLLVTARPEKGPEVRFLGEVLFEALQTHA
jgi:hypothetical protein